MNENLVWENSLEVKYYALELEVSEMIIKILFWRIADKKRYEKKFLKKIGMSKKYFKKIIIGDKFKITEEKYNVLMFYKNEINYYLRENK